MALWRVRHGVRGERSTIYHYREKQSAYIDYRELIRTYELMKHTFMYVFIEELIGSDWVTLDRFNASSDRQFHFVGRKGEEL